MPAIPPNIWCPDKSLPKCTSINFRCENALGNSNFYYFSAQKPQTPLKKDYNLPCSGSVTWKTPICILTSYLYPFLKSVYSPGLKLVLRTPKSWCSSSFLKQSMTKAHVKVAGNTLQKTFHFKLHRSHSRMSSASKQWAVSLPCTIMIASNNLLWIVNLWSFSMLRTYNHKDSRCDNAKIQTVMNW